MSPNVLPSQNTEWGFWGTIGRFQSPPAADPARAWAIAFHAVAAATGASPEGVRDFLDGIHGRHFADGVSNGLHAGLRLEPAIEAAVARWMGWRIDRRISREAGIPQGLPYLAGFTNYYAMLAEPPV